MLKFDCTLSHRRFLISRKRVGSFLWFSERNMVYFNLVTGNAHFNLWSHYIWLWRLINVFVDDFISIYINMFLKKICYIIWINSTCMLIYRICRNFSVDPILVLSARLFSLLKLCIANNTSRLEVMYFIIVKNR